jgi:chemotaxis methyl-accepting protein methylase
VTGAADDLAFESLARRISEGGGLAIGAYNTKCIRRRIAVRMRACGVHTYADYQHLLDHNPAEYEHLRDALTINVTRFFRNVETWERLAAGFLPPLWDPPSGALRIWSAGCSSGEEAYSLAILAAELAEARGHPEALERVQVDATDVDRESLRRAEAGQYRAEALMETPIALRARYFEPSGEEYQVVSRIRRQVRVRPLDLTQEQPAARAYDLIVCRNVVIYFDRAMQERLFGQFVQALRPEGLLVLGKVETLFGAAREQLTLLDARERIYRRPA